MDEWDEDNSEECGYHDAKAVSTKEETIISSPGHQPHECDA